jgi:carbon monoxide dehydrogenase subunit G
MSSVAESVDVHVPVRTAYNQWTQFESFPAFMSGVVTVQQLDDQHTHWVTEIGGAHREFDAEIVEQRPDERIAWHSTQGDIQHSGAVSFQPLAADETRVTVDMAWEPSGMVEKVGSAVGIDHRQVKADLQRFKEFIEERGAETGQWRGEVPGHTPTQTPATAAMAAGTRDVVDVLIDQHTQVKQLLAQTSAARGAEKQRLFDQLAQLLEMHEKGEQRVVHPVTRATGGAGAQTAEARVTEEGRADRLIAEIKDLSANNAEFDAWFEQLRQAVLTHAEHEENEEFPKLRQDVAPERLRTMAEELIAVQSGRSCVS